MQIAASVDAPLVFAGDNVRMTISFEPSEDAPLLLSGYAAVQGSFTSFLPDNFADARKKGVVLGHHGIEYGKPQQSFFSGIFGGLKQLIEPEVDEGDYPIFTTAQALLFTDLCVDKPHKFELTAKIPAEVPPSYRSRSIFITYHLVLGFQSLGQAKTPAATRLFLPFRVYSRSTTPYDLQSPTILPAPVVSPTEQYDMSAFISRLLSGEPEKRHHDFVSQVSFDIAKAGTPIATLVLSRPSVRVGDVLTASLKFERPCVHIGAFLELAETIGDSTSYQTYARQSLGVFGYDQVALSLPTLASITPKLDTVQVSASWSLRLDFAGLVGSAFVEAEGLVAKSQVDVEVFSCRIPIVVLPPDSGHGATKVWAFT